MAGMEVKYKTLLQMLLIKEKTLLKICQVFSVCSVTWIYKFQLMGSSQTSALIQSKTIKQCKLQIVLNTKDLLLKIPNSLSNSDGFGCRKSPLVMGWTQNEQGFSSFCPFYKA